MELVLVGAAALGALAWVGTKAVARAKATLADYRLRRDAYHAFRREFRSRLASSKQQRRAAHQKLNNLARQLQVALLTLDQAPDFQRAAAWAQSANGVPAWFRQRIFHRFRPKLVSYMAKRIAAGGDPDSLLQSLTGLVQALGIAAFEAQYIALEAQQRLSATASSGTASFDAQLQELQRVHEERLAALRGLSGMNADAKEQLIEAEQSRFHEEMLAVSQRDRPDA